MPTLYPLSLDTIWAGMGILGESGIKDSKIFLALALLDCFRDLILVFSPCFTRDVNDAYTA